MRKFLLPVLAIALAVFALFPAQPAEASLAPYYITKIAGGTDTQALGTGNVDLTAVVAVPTGASGLLLEFAVTAVTNSTATSMQYGLTAYDGAGNNLYDLGTAAANQRLGVNWTVFTAPMAGRVSASGEAPDVNFGGGAVTYGYTSKPFVTPQQVKVQRLVAGGVLTSISTTWNLYAVWAKAATTLSAPSF